jgi:hypothetical protein
MSYSEAVAAKRGELLTQYGFNRRWVRWDRPVRVVDAFPRRAGHYLGWVYADLPPGERAAVVRISQRNFDRFYRELETTGEMK